MPKQTAAEARARSPEPARRGAALSHGRRLGWLSARSAAGALANWCAWLLCAFLVAAQLSGAVWGEAAALDREERGRSPALGPRALPAALLAAAAPSTGRALACVLRGRAYEPVAVADALAAGAAVRVSSAAGDGFRLWSRASERSALADADAAAASSYADACVRLAASAAAVADACAALGYSVASGGGGGGGALRVVPSAAPAEALELPDALPALLLAPLDGAASAPRVAVPGRDGCACEFRLHGAVMEAVGRSAREAAALAWLGLPPSNASARAVWRDGWLVAPGVGAGLFSVDAFSSDARGAASDALGAAYRAFDLSTGAELDCARAPAACAPPPATATWGAELRRETAERWRASALVADADGFGVAHAVRVVRAVARSAYSWEALVSNVSLSLVLARWLVAQLVLLAGFAAGRCASASAGVGCVSSSRAFNLLPLALLPRLPATLAALCALGGRFRGGQAALAECWFAVYPAAAELLWLLFSMLNVAAKLARRRASDALFAPTLLALCALHLARQRIADRAVGADAGGRLETLVPAAEAAELSLTAFFSSDLAWRLGGHLMPLAAAKLALLAANLLPLLLAEYVPPVPQPDTALRGVERALAIRASNVGGLGRSAMYLAEPAAADHDRDKKEEKEEKKKSKAAAHQNERLALNGYELVRLGYVVLGGKFLVTLDAWDSIWATAALRRVYHLYNHRVVLFPLRDARGLAEVAGQPLMCRLDDERLAGISAWQISAQPIRC